MKNQKQLSLQLFGERLQERRNKLALWLKAEIRLVPEPELVLGNWQATSYRTKADAGCFTFQADGNLSRTTARSGTSSLGWRMVESEYSPEAPGTLVAWYGAAKTKLQPGDYLGLDFPFVFLTDRNELVLTNDDTSLFYVAVRGTVMNCEGEAPAGPPHQTLFP